MNCVKSISGSQLSKHSTNLGATETLFFSSKIIFPSKLIAVKTPAGKRLHFSFFKLKYFKAL